MTTACHVSVSLDGYLAGPDQSLDQPIGARGDTLHAWVWRADEPGHEADAAAWADLQTPRGAYVMGRNMFGPERGPWSGDWRGWWGDDPPYHAPVFVLTHHPQPDLEMAGGTTFHFVSDGFDAAYARAVEAADFVVEVRDGTSPDQAWLPRQADLLVVNKADAPGFRGTGFRPVC